MKRISVVTVMVLALSLISMKVYGGEAMKRPSNVKGDSTAMLLIDQGIHFYTERQLEAALSSFDMAIQVAPTLSEAYFDAGTVAMELGMREKGISYLEEFKKQRPGESSPFLSSINDAVAVASSGFREFGFAAILGSIFVFIAAAYMIGDSQSWILSGAGGLFVMGFANSRLFPEKAKYMVYPLLKRGKEGASMGLLSLMERRKKALATA